MKIHFGSGGNYLHFYLGIAAKIQSSGIHISHLSGVSAGTFPATFLAYNIDINKNYYNWNYTLCNKIKETENIIESFHYSCKPLLENKKCLIEFDIWTSKIIIPHNLFNFSEIKLVSHKFSGYDDIFNKIACSCYIPIFCPDKTLMYKYNDNYYLDGILTFNTYKDYNLLINYKDYIKNYKILDKFPSSDFEKNEKLFELGKESFDLRLID